MHWHPGWRWRLIVVIAYFVYFVKIVRCDKHPGPEDSGKMSNRMVNMANGLNILIFFLITFFLLNLSLRSRPHVHYCVLFFWA